MAIWDRLLKRVLEPVVTKSLKEIQDKETDLTKIFVSNVRRNTLSPAIAGKKSTTRSFPKGISTQTLRAFSNYYPILRACINYRKRQITQLEWDIVPKEVITDKKKKQVAEEKGKKLKERLLYPAGDKTMKFREFLNKMLEDVLILDAVAVYKRQKKGGGLYGFLPIDASTIDLILNEDGTTPVPPNVAYAQKINGEVVEKMTIEQLIYGMMNPRTNNPYGLSLVETLILTVTAALKLSSYNLAYLTEGNVPEGFVELPKDVASNPEQLQLWQEAWDAMFAGDVRYQRKIKFLPEGMTWNPIRKQEDIQFERFEKWLLLQTCSVMEVAPQAIGFQFERGKGATETEWEIGKERGLFPLANFLKEIFDEIVQEDFAEPDYRFIWTNINPTNKKEESDVFGQLVRTGAVSVDEWRIAEGFDPVGLPHYIMTPVGPVLVKDFIKMSEAGENPFIPDYGSGDEGPSSGKKPNEAITPQKEIKPGSSAKKLQKKLLDINREEVVRELKRWKKATANDLKQSKPFRDFTTDIIDDRTKQLIKSSLSNIKTKEDIDELFSPFISQENRVINAMLDLYGDISDIVEYGDKKVKANKKSN
jgi:hypothetical protein